MSLEKQRSVFSKSTAIPTLTLQSSQDVAGSVCWYCMVKQHTLGKVCMLCAQNPDGRGGSQSNRGSGAPRRPYTLHFQLVFSLWSFRNLLLLPKFFAHTPPHTLLHKPWGGDPQFKKLGYKQNIHFSQF